jgi:5-(carboxyamino)imidazole ribonucleotide synthase
LNVGIIGSGQLGRMLIMEGRKLPFNYYICDAEMGPAARISDGYFPVERYREFVDKCDVVTFEFEHVDERPLLYAEEQGKLLPGMNAIELKRSRSREKRFFTNFHLPTAPYVISNFEELNKALDSFDHSVLKKSSGGYDGKGIWFADRPHLPEHLPPDEYVVEEKVDFDYEASIIACRGIDGEIQCHAPSFNLNKSGILIYNSAPCADAGMKEIAVKLLESLDYVGVMGIEFFVKDGKAMINEFAPRVHNTGHHTLHGSSISQFEHHIRAITGLPLSDARLLEPSGIVNILGIELSAEMLNSILKLGGTHIYWYGKEVRHRRKVGHVNVNATTEGELSYKIEEVMNLLYSSNVEAFL